MKRIAVWWLGIFVLSSLWADTPEVGVISTALIEDECPIGETCGFVDPEICSSSDIQVSGNNNSTFDLLFNRFELSTEWQGATLTKAGCQINLEVDVPENQRVFLSRVSVSGIAFIPADGEAVTSIAHYIGGRSSRREETFIDNGTFVVSHNQELSNEFTGCGDENLQVKTRVDVLARQSPSYVAPTEVILTSGSGGLLRYELVYQECEEPIACTVDQFEMDDQCFNLGMQCSAYDGIGSKVCHNTFDNLSCVWDGSNNTCKTSCGSNQYEHEGVCYNLASQCSQYDGTNTQVCNNGSDNLLCDWDDATKTCYQECRGDWFEASNGECYYKYGQCSQYNDTSVEICNTGEDNLLCDLISFSDSNPSVAGTCVSSCPSDYFSLDGYCFKESGSCSQYNNTSMEICNTGEDNLSCDFIPFNDANGSVAGTCVSSCPSGYFSLNGYCFAATASCSQYNGTDSDTCNTGLDNMMCDWNASTKVCYEE